MPLPTGSRIGSYEIVGPLGSIFGLEESGPALHLVLELVDGETLAARLQRGPLPVREALAVAVPVASAIDVGAPARVGIRRDR